MALTTILFRVYPEEGSLDAAMAEIRKTLAPEDMQTEELAFGIKAIKVLFKFDDTKTKSSSIEESLKAVKGVGEVEVLEESLL